MKKLLLAPAVAVVAGSMTFAGTATFATPSAETPNVAATPTEAAAGLTVEGDDTHTVKEMEEGITLTVKGLKPGQKVEVDLLALVDARSVGTATADKNGEAEVTLKNNCTEGTTPEQCWSFPEYSVVVKVDDKIVESDGLEKVYVTDSSITAEVSKDKVFKDDLTSKETAPVFEGTGLEPNKQYDARLFHPDPENIDEPFAEISFTTDDKGNFSVPLVLSPEVAEKAVGQVDIVTYGDQRVLPVRSFTVTDTPVDEPTDEPTDQPTEEPTDQPTDEPTDQPTDEPTDQPTDEPTDQPTDEPTDQPTDEPTDQPTDEPTDQPTDEPTDQPTDEPTDQPTDEPTDQPGEPELSVPYDTKHATPFRDNGYVIEYKNLEPGKKYTWMLRGGDGLEVSDSFTADKANGSFDVYVAPDTELDALVGKYDVLLKDEDGNQVGETSFEVVKDEDNSGNEDEDHARYQMTLNPRELSVQRFLDKKQGVAVAVAGLQPGEKFTYSVAKVDGDGKVENLFRDATADKEGRWGTVLHGIRGDQPIESFVGTYKVTVKSEEGVLTDEFTVTNGKKDDSNKDDSTDNDAKPGDNGNGDDSNTDTNTSDDSSSGNLPRTGMEISGLIAGGVLLTVGVATVLVTRRRTK